MSLRSNSPDFISIQFMDIGSPRGGGNGMWHSALHANDLLVRMVIPKDQNRPVFVA
jgi:hypothetical protein